SYWSCRSCISFCLQIFFCLLVSSNLCTCLIALFVGTVVQCENKEHGNEECNCDTNGVTQPWVHCWDGKRGGEHESVRLDVEDAHHDTACQTTRQEAEVGLLESEQNTVEGRLGNAAERTSQHATQGNLTHGLVSFLNGEQEHAGDQAKAGEVPGTHWSLNEVVTQGVDVLDHDGV